MNPLWKPSETRLAKQKQSMIRKTSSMAINNGQRNRRNINTVELVF